MPRRFEVSDMMTACKQRCDMEGQLSISDSEWKSMISTIWAELASEVSGSGMRYFESTATKTINGTDWDEPADHLSTVAVSQVLTSGRRRTLNALMTQEANAFSGSSRGSAVAYALIDDVIKLYPTPPNGEVYEMLYIPQPPKLSDLADDYVIDVVSPDGEAFLIWGVAVLALHKRDSDTSVARAEKEAARERLRNWAVMRDFHEPRRRQSNDFGYVDESDWRFR